MSNIRKRIGAFAALLLVMALLSSAMIPKTAQAWTTYPLKVDDVEIVNALDYMRNQQTADGSIGGFSPSAWVVMAIAATGQSPQNWKVGANPSIVDYLAANAGDATSVNDYARMILAIVAAKENTTNFGGINFMAQLVASYDGTQIGDPALVNDDFWGILALIAAGENKTSAIIQNSALFIKNAQKPDGG